jgi:integrase
VRHAFPSRGLPFGLVRQRLSTGEHFGAVVDVATGIPPQMPLLFSFECRTQGGSDKLYSRLRRVAELYSWCRLIGEYDLDALLIGGGIPTSADLRTALRHCDSDEVLTSARSTLSIAGRRNDAVASHSRHEIRRPHLWNERAAAWHDFLDWVANPGHWKAGTRVGETYESIERRFRVRSEIADALSRRAAIQEPNQRDPISGDEHLAIVEAIGPKNGSFAHSPFRGDSAARNWLMYQVARWGGCRIGEILKLTGSDLPTRESAGQRLVRELRGDPRYLRVVRRPDDFDDPREREARVKRESHDVWLPDDLAEDLVRFWDELGPNGRGTRAIKTQYLFVSTRPGRAPLSQSAAEKIIIKIGDAAADVFEAQHPGAPHTLHRLSWHRLRHRRACELLLHFFPDGRVTDRSKLDFLDHFGWARWSSARPYIERLDRREGDLVLADIRQHLVQHSDN